MAHAAGDHVRDRLEAAMRVVGKSADVVLRIVRAERVEHEEWVQPPLQRLGQHAGKCHAGAVRRGLSGDQALDGTRSRHRLDARWGENCRHEISWFNYAATASSICSYAEATALCSASGPSASPSA